MAITYFALATTEVGAGGASAIEFTSIPQTYTDLVIHLSTRSTTNSTVANLQHTFNSSSSGYSGIEIFAAANGTSGSGDGGTTSARFQGGYANASQNASNFFAGCIYYIPGYTSNFAKVTNLYAGQTALNDAAYVDIFSGTWNNTSAVTRIRITPLTDNFVQYSTATLYGIKNA